jgi:hypothetical protein
VKKIFNERQIKAIELLAEGGRQYIEIASMVGVSPDTLRDWRKDPEFQDEVRNRCRDLLRETEPFLYRAALAEVSKSGSHQHIKLLLERLARLEDLSSGIGHAHDIMFTWRSGNDPEDARNDK